MVVRGQERAGDTRETEAGCRRGSLVPGGPGDGGRPGGSQHGGAVNQETLRADPSRPWVGNDWWRVKRKRGDPLRRGSGKGPGLGPEPGGERGVASAPRTQVAPQDRGRGGTRMRGHPPPPRRDGAGAGRGPGHRGRGRSGSVLDRRVPPGHPLPLGLHDSARPGPPRPPTASNPPPLISSSKHPSVLERQMAPISQVRQPRPPSGVTWGHWDQRRLGGGRAHLCPWQCWGPSWPDPTPGTWDLGRSLHGVVRSLGFAARPCGLGQATQPLCLGFPSVGRKASRPHSGPHVWTLGLRPSVYGHMPLPAPWSAGWGRGVGLVPGRLHRFL